ncbi:MAG: IS1182 family transposase [Terriglobales bacterium]
MSKTYRPYEPDQILLLPPSVKDWLPSGHLAHFISELVEESLDLKAIIEVYEREERGYPPYHPVMLTKVWLYAYCVGIPSSRKIEKRLMEDVAFRMLAANNTPNFRTISDFRKENLTALDGLFLQVLKLCQKAGMVKLGHVALDGTKMKANASKHKAMSYDRMKKDEARLAAEVKEFLRQAEEADAREDAEYGPDKRGDELPAELAFREGRLKKIREAKEALEFEAREEAEAKKQQAEAGRDRDSKSPEAVPRDKAQKNFTDPESRIMPSSSEKGSFLQGYNCQAAVDDKHQVIVACDTTQQTNDSQQAKPMLEQVKKNTGKAPDKVSMDAGYTGEDNIVAVEALGSEAFIATSRKKHSAAVPSAPRGRIPKNLSVVDRMRRKLLTKKGRAIYAKRKEIVEPVFGQTKQCRGFRQFLLRGMKKVKSEWSLICTTHNLLKLWRKMSAKTALQAA